MFGKEKWISRFMLKPAVRVVKFQSPCAGNMFGKFHLDKKGKKVISAEFQSPCAGNMFGKAKAGASCARLLRWSFNPRVRGTCLVSQALAALCKEYSIKEVSIPVCGEHVW
jgi:hypothetical protein